MSDFFETVWANDNCPKKAGVFLANFSKDIFNHNSIENIESRDLPPAYVSWASFPCQDLSIAGKLSGLEGKRSGLFWEWLRIIKAITHKPPVLVIENVVGLLTLKNGEYFKSIYNELKNLNYNVGALVIDAKYWLPQSRQRVFIIGVDTSIDISPFISNTANWAHPFSLINAARDIPDHVFWNIPAPICETLSLKSIIDFSFPIHETRSERNISLISRRHKEAIFSSLWPMQDVYMGYKRTRKTGQTLEIRFDGLSGCLRTAKGGSSKQLVLYKKENKLLCRYLSAREAARLMGVPDSFILPENENDGYSAMGDAVAVPVTKYLARYLLKPIADIYYESNNSNLVKKVSV